MKKGLIGKKLGMTHFFSEKGEFVPVKAGMGGQLVEVAAKRATFVHRGDTLAWIERS